MYFYLQIFKDDETLFQVFSVLSVLALNEKDIQKFIDYFMVAQVHVHIIPHYCPKVITLHRYFTKGLYSKGENGM